MAMTAGMYVKVPEDLADSLADDGFRLAGTERGVELYAETLLTTSANLVTVLVGSHEISRFIKHLWASARHRAPGSKVVLERGGRRMAITFEHEGFGTDGPPATVVHGMTALLEALAEPDQDGHRQ